MANNTENRHNLPPGPGRPKGCENKFTSLKQMFLNVSKRLGGEDALLKFAKDNPKEYWRMLHVMLPRNVVEEIRQDIKITWDDPSQLPGKTDTPPVEDVN